MTTELQVLRPDDPDHPRYPRQLDLLPRWAHATCCLVRDAVSVWEPGAVLQVITGMYFRDVRLNETDHRWTLYTNANFLGQERVDLPIGHLIPATDWQTVGTVLAHATERLEALRLDGSEDFVISTGGDAIIEDLAMVLSFALNATFTSIRSKADRLIRNPSGSHRTATPADILPRTFSPNLILRVEDIADLTEFMSNLLALNRPVYEQAMRAIRRIVTASERAAEDPTLAYTDYVAALESLSAGVEMPDITWDRLDSRKRKILNTALDTLQTGDSEVLRAAILKAERAGIKHRYTEFVMSHVQPSFFREESVGSNAPIRRPSLRRAVASAYDARSKNLHELRELDIETWLLVGGRQTVTPPDKPLMLTHVGLNSLARHVVRTFVQRGSTQLDDQYQWRNHLPNVIHAQLASEFYLGAADAIQPTNAATRAGEFMSHLIETLVGKTGMKVDMRPALGRIEKLLAVNRAREVREPLLAMYLLWHRFMTVDLHRPAPEKVLRLAEEELKQPSIYSFATGLFLGLTPPWPIDELCELAEDRYDALHAGRPIELPDRLDSALWIFVAESLWLEGAHSLACAAVGRAVECAPGHAGLLALEREIVQGHDINFDIRAFLLEAPQAPSV